MKKYISIVLSLMMLLSVICVPCSTILADEDEEGVAGFVTRLYEVVLNREPDEYGLNDWVEKLNNHELTASEVADGFFNSQEYLSQDKTNEEYVTDLYNCMLGRTPDQTGLVHWTNMLTNGTPRINIMKGFVDSTEFASICEAYGVEKGTVEPEYSDSQLSGIHNFVVRLYHTTLKRNPDNGGMLDWQHKLREHEITGAETAYGFVFSQECIAATEENSDFVTVLYKALLGREADADGLADWVGRLEDGQSREAIFAGFVNSAEFTGICETYGIDRGEFSVGRQIDPNKPMICLTFDDGPCANTSRILDTLEEYGQVATFFVIGSSAQYYPETLARMEEIGCEIGNHTWNHPSLSRLGADAIRSEIAQTNAVINDAVGHDATVMRPPYGSYNDTVRANVGTPLIIWSVDTRDWETRSTTSTINSVLTDARDGSIVLMHDIHPSTVDAACQLIPELVSRGYQLVTVSEIAQYRGGMEDGTAYHSFRPQ